MNSNIWKEFNETLKFAIYNIISIERKREGQADRQRDRDRQANRGTETDR